MKRLFIKIISCCLLALGTVVFISCEKDSNIKQYVYPAPEVSGYSPAEGYVKSRVAILGHNFGDRAEAVKVSFGGILADNVLSCNNNCVVVEVPEEAMSGDITLQVWTNSVTVGNYEIWPSPVVSEMVTQSGSTIIRPGETVTIKGTGFGTAKEDVLVKFGGVNAEVTKWSETEIQTVAPENFPTGEVVIVVNGFEVVAGAALNPFAKGDVTVAYLKNYRQPFKIDPNMTDAQLGTSPGTYLPADWIVNDAARSMQNSGASEKVAGLNNDNLLLQAGWGANNFTNGKLYQTTTLPKGKYRLTVNLKEYGVKTSTLYITVAEGNELPDITDIEDNELVKGLYLFVGENKTSSSVQIEFELTEESTEVALGFVCSMTANGWFRATELRLELL